MKKIILLIVFCLTFVNHAFTQQKSPNSLDITLQGAFSFPVSDSMKKVLNSFPGIHAEANLNMNKNFSVFLGFDYDFITFKQEFVNTLIGTGDKQMEGSKQIAIYIGPKYFFHKSKNEDFRSNVSLGAGFYHSSLGDYTLKTQSQNQTITSTYITSSTSQTGINLGVGMDYDLDENFLFVAGVKIHRVFGKDNVTLTTTINGRGYAFTTNLQAYSYFTIGVGFGYRIKF